MALPKGRGLAIILRKRLGELMQLDRMCDKCVWPQIEGTLEILPLYYFYNFQLSQLFQITLLFQLLLRRMQMGILDIFL